MRYPFSTVYQFRCYSLFACIGLLIVGCTTSGSIKHNINIDDYKKVYFSEKIGLFDQKYIPYIGRMLERVGFELLMEKPQELSPDVLECRFEIDQGNLFNFRVHVSLWDKWEMIAAGEAVNNGWGTLLATDAATRDLVEKAAKALEKQLRPESKQKTHYSAYKNTNLLDSDY
ncbi:MAG: hypothetical protein OEZ55_07975 [Nitrospinota bacterium]|nr:hypothetical protein [Nitrospinota bacterium]MDH5756586.1 hypothetical protein [Nitrospinota bacterium]